MIGTRKQRVTIRLTDWQMLCLKELTTSLNTSYSMLIRSIIQDFLVRNEDTLERIAQEKNNQELTDNDYANTEYQTKGN
jgi:hypothetical protein